MRRLHSAQCTFSRLAWLPAAAALLLASPRPSLAEEFRNLTLEQALERLQDRGLSILYSSDLIEPWMQVREEPTATSERGILDQILAPYGVKAVDGPNGSLMLVRATPPTPPAPDRATEPRRVVYTSSDLEEVIVSASHYEFVREPTPSVTSMTVAELQLLPDVGDDPLRAVARLPGTASSDFNAKTNIRGGEADETLVRFDDLRLHNPFHLKDFQSVFSTIDPGVISGINIYAGGFPAAFGDRMSSVIDIDPLLPSESAYREVALSFFNTSVLGAGSFNEERSDWLLSARRGNLDLIVDVLNSEIGKPVYMDIYGRVRHRLSDAFTMSASVLVFDDAIELFDDADREEGARADYRDEYLWLRFDIQPSKDLSGNVLLARSAIESSRSGSADQPGIATGTLDDRRDFTINSLQLDWTWRAADDVLLQFGGEWRGTTGSYDYSDQVDFALLFLTPGASPDESRTRQLSARPDGAQYGAFTNLRMELLENLTADVGMRWDKETLSQDRNDQLSPRLSLLYAFGEQTHIRTSWGRFYQSQAVSELQISDGVSDFLAPQRSDHFVASIEHRHASGIAGRLEVYRKDYRHVRPRFENLVNTFVLLPELKPDRIRIAPDRAIAKGAELTIRRAGSPPLSWWLSYSWSSVEDESAATRTRRSWDQTHLVTGGIAWQNDRWELTVAGTSHTGWPTTDIELVATDPIPLVATGARNAQRLGAYSSIDARVARKFIFDRAGSLTVFAEVVNLLNESNECCVEYELEQEAGTATTLDVERREYLPFTPSLGFVWRF